MNRREMGLLRSEDMTLFEISIPKENAWDIMNEIGNLNSVHLINLNKKEQVFSLLYAPFIKRCEETEKKIWVSTYILSSFILNLPNVLVVYNLKF